MNNQTNDQKDTMNETEKLFSKNVCCGIYGLRNKINGKWYIGQSVDINERWKTYRRYGCKRQIKLYAALIKYGYENFEEVLLETCQQVHWILDYREMYWIQKYQSLTNGYNLTKGGGGSWGRVLSDETKNKIRQSKVGQVLSEEHKKILTTCLIGKKQTEEHKKKRCSGLIGKHRSEETKEKLRIAFAGKKRGRQSPEVIAKRVASRKATMLARSVGEL
jgi:group I intron endonuclease